MAYFLGIPVYKMLKEMPHSEYVKWNSYFKQRPIGWREDQRTYLGLAVQGVKEPQERIFPTLKALADNIPAEVKALPKGAFLAKMLRAKGGDTEDWTPPWINSPSK